MSIVTEPTRRDAKRVRTQITRAAERGQKFFTLPDLDAETVQELRSGGLKVEWMRSRNHYKVSWD